MVARFIHVGRLLIVLASRHRSLVLENLALRQQLAVYRRTRPTPAIRWSDRLFKPAEAAPASGQYGIVGPRGGDTGEERTVVRGETLPPTASSGQSYKINDRTKNGSGRG